MTTNKMIGHRIKLLRERAGMNQRKLADILGLKDRQTVSSIEGGTRGISAQELIQVVNHFEVPLTDLTDPCLLFGQESFSWRQTNVAQPDLDEFERKAGKWIGAYRVFVNPEKRIRKLIPNLRLTHKSSFEEAISAGEAVANHLNLGDTPALELSQAIEEHLEILVLMVDTKLKISGAACHLPELDAILINRNESQGRRNADLSHELFHIITWDTMRPERVESAEEIWNHPLGRKRKRNERIEQLADNFSFGLLMPDRVLNNLLDDLPEPKIEAEWLDAAAAKLGVSSINLKWRLVNSKRAPKLKNISNEELSQLARRKENINSKPPLFSKPYFEAISSAIQKGDVSVRRVAALLDAPLEDIGDMFDQHKLTRPKELQF